MDKLTQEQKSDLLDLADHMEVSVPPGEFNMTTWGAVMSCGTVGCLAFHAAQVFPDRLKTERCEYSYDVINLQTGNEDEQAFEDAFGPGTGALCFPSSYGPSYGLGGVPLTPADVAAGIRKFVLDQVEKL